MQLKERKKHKEGNNILCDNCSASGSRTFAESKSRFLMPKNFKQSTILKKLRLKYVSYFLWDFCQELQAPRQASRQLQASRENIQLHWDGALSHLWRIHFCLPGSGSVSKDLTEYRLNPAQNQRNERNINEMKVPGSPDHLCSWLSACPTAQSPGTLHTRSYRNYGHQHKGIDQWEKRRVYCGIIR